jgi:transcriptional regulator with XRE-family HTH domain
MHAFRRYLRDGLDARKWLPADFARASKLSRQLVSQLLTDDRDVLPSVPKRETILGVAKAFGTNESHVMTYVFEAMGYSIADVRAGVDLATVPSRALLEALAARLPDEEGPSHGTPTSQPDMTLTNEEGDTVILEAKSPSLESLDSAMRQLAEAEGPLRRALDTHPEPVTKLLIWGVESLTIKEREQLVELLPDHAIELLNHSAATGYALAARRGEIEPSEADAPS